MRKQKVIAGLCLLSALALSALAAQSASAATKGTTLFTCKKVTPAVGTAGFSKAHCKAEDAVSSNAEYEHFPIAENTTTEITGTTEDTEGKSTVSKLKATISGVEVEIQSELAHVLPEVKVGEKVEKSWVTNAKEPEGAPKPGEHYYHGEAWVTYTKPIVTKPAEKGCKVKGEDITTEKLKFTTTEQEDNVKFEPASGVVFAKFEIEGCGPTEALKALNGVYEVKGSVKGQPNGATLNFTHSSVTTQGTLTLRGQKAGFESSVTIKGTDKAAGDEVDTALSPTTIETP
jgi:hypothetical protein